MPKESGMNEPGKSLSRRSLLKGAGAAAAGVSFASVLAACSSDGDTSTGGTGGSSDTTTASEGSGGGNGGEVSFGSNFSDTVPKKLFKSRLTDTSLVTK